MPDLDLIKQGEQGVRNRRERFARGRPGNPAGRPPGCRNHVNRAARLLLAGEGEALTRKAVEPAPAGDPNALRLCLAEAGDTAAGKPGSTLDASVAPVGRGGAIGLRARPGCSGFRSR
jgi:hypothetical protein